MFSNFDNFNFYGMVGVEFFVGCFSTWLSDLPAPGILAGQADFKIHQLARVPVPFKVTYPITCSYILQTEGIKYPFRMIYHCISPATQN
jgi:hypothetical protein